VFVPIFVHEIQHAVQVREGFDTGASFDLDTFKKAKTEEERRAITNNYLNSAGEVEARLTEARRNMTPEQRRAIPPWEMYDVAEEEQNVGGENGGRSESRRRAPQNDPIVSSIMQKLKYGKNYDPNNAHRLAYSARSGEVALFHDKGNGKYDIIVRVNATQENHDRLISLANSYNSQESPAFVDAGIQELENLRRVSDLDRGNDTANGRTSGRYGDLAVSEQGNETREIAEESARDSGEVNPALRQRTTTTTTTTATRGYGSMPLQKF
jgi:hypothetical protein